MIGIILWTNPKRGTGLIWCEDQADLAFIPGLHHLEDASGWPEVGDLVQLDCTQSGGLRIGRNVRVLDRNFNTAIADDLRAQAMGQVPASPDRAVVPVPVADAATCASEKPAQMHRPISVLPERPQLRIAS